MANLIATSTWDNVLQLETTHQAIAGAGGTMNLQAQALANRTQFLADTKLNTTDFESTLKTQINASGDASIYACRAWVNFNGTGTVAIRASGNVSSITDSGVGLYTVNFTTAMQDANYALIGTCNSTYSDQQFSGVLDVTGTKATTSQIVRIKVNGTNGVFMDSSDINIAVFR